jgi:hypothetical protein
MSNTILEQLRHKYEEIEQYEKVISKSLTYRDNNPNESIVSETIIKRCQDKIQQNSRDIIDLFEDKNENFKQEKLIMTGNIDYMNSNLCLLKPININNNNNYYSNLLMKKRKADIWVNFYDKIKEIKMLNKSGNDINHSTTSDKIFNNLISDINLKTLFTNEENYGKCLDLHELYHEYINIPNIFNSSINNKKLSNTNRNQILLNENMEDIIKFDYLNYLKNIDNFKNIPLKIKKSEEYIKYIKHLAQYLKSFFVKIYPLVNFNEIQDIIDSKFEDDQEHLDNNNKTIELKEEEEEHDKNQLYCQICNKSFAKETLMDAHMKSKKHLKKLNASKNNNNNILQEKNKSDEDIIREIKYNEYQIIRYKDILQNIIDNTINQIHKKQTMTREELELDRQNELNLKKTDKEDKKKIFNPKNIPLDWDGKPLPYWLYKVHGLGIEHKCEICGGASYWGRRAFEHHFQEWRHAYGMKCLRLPNTLQFKNITKIEDALKLHHKLIEDKNKTEFNPDVEEQYEDENGNVFNKKMIMDLKKQGLDTNLNIKNKENNLDLD